MTKQERVNLWTADLFGERILFDKRERAQRFLEEAIELAQAMGLTALDVALLADTVMARPPGEPRAEIGGVMVTLYALGTSIGVNVDDAAEQEIVRVNTPEVRARVLRRQAEKHAAGIAVFQKPVDATDSEE